MRTKRLWRIIAWAGLLGLLLALPVLASPVESHRAGVVIDYGDGRVETYCVTFTEQTLTGYELLERTGVEIVAAFEANGAAVCHLGGADGVGCAASNCFCEFPLKYWSYWNQQGGAWGYSNIGASSASITAGTVNGWLWGDATQPPAGVSLDVICAAAEPTPTPTATASPTATPTVTPTPSATPTPSPTATTAESHAQVVQATATLEPYANFWADAEELDAGTCALLRWDTWGLTELRLDDEPVVAQGTETVCPCELQEYELEATYPDGSTEVLTVKIEVNGKCEGGGTGMIVMDTPSASPPAPLMPTATPTPVLANTPALPGVTPEDGSDVERPPATALPPADSPAPAMSILPTPTPPPLLPTATAPLAGQPPDGAPQSDPAATWTLAPTPEAEATLPEGTAAALLATPTRHLMDELDVTAALTASTYISAPLEGAPAATEALSPVVTRVLENWGGYVTFGLMLVLLGSAHLLVQRRR